METSATETETATFATESYRNWRNLIRPRQLIQEDVSDEQRYGKR